MEKDVLRLVGRSAHYGEGHLVVYEVSAMWREGRDTIDFGDAKEAEVEIALEAYEAVRVACEPKV